MEETEEIVWQGKFVTAKPSGRVAGPKVRHYRKADLLDGLAAGQVAVSIVDRFEIVTIHHQYAKRPAIGRRTACLTPQFRKK